MPYTLTMFLLWALAAALVGVAVGWALRSITARRDLLRQRSLGGDPRELDRLRRLLGEVEAERDGLRDELGRGADEAGAAPGGAGGGEAGGRAGDGRVDDRADGGADGGADGRADVGDGAGVGDRADGRADGRAADGAAGDGAAVAGRVVGDGAQAVATTGAEPGGDPDGGDVVHEEPPALDLDRAAEVLGRPVRLDDLTVVEGIGPKIAELCGGIGVTTWRALADTPVDDLGSMLDAAGSRYAMHRPDHWPRQAALLAEGRWEEFRDLLHTLGRRR